MTDWLMEWGWLHFFIAVLISGSIFGMRKQLLLKAGIRYFIPLMAGVVGAFLLTGTVGLLIGYGFREAIIFIAAPIMSGGIGAGALPLSEIYAEHIQGGEPGYYFSIMMPAVAIANVLAIVFASILNTVGRLKPKLTGNGVIMKGFELKDIEPPIEDELKLSDLGAGLFLAVGLYIAGSIISRFCLPGAPGCHAGTALFPRHRQTACCSSSF